MDGQLMVIVICPYCQTPYGKGHSNMKANRDSPHQLLCLNCGHWAAFSGVLNEAFDSGKVEGAREQVEKWNGILGRS